MGRGTFPFHEAGAAAVPSETLPAFLRLDFYEQQRRIGCVRQSNPITDGSGSLVILMAAMAFMAVPVLAANAAMGWRHSAHAVSPSRRSPALTPDIRACRARDRVRRSAHAKRCERRIDALEMSVMMNVDGCISQPPAHSRRA